MATSNVDQSTHEFASKHLPGSPNLVISPPKNKRADLQAMAALREGGDLDVADLAFINPASHRELASRRKELLENRYDRYNPEQLAMYRQLLRDAGASDREDWGKMKELADYRMFEINYDVMASPWALAAFQMINLATDELPLITFPRSRNLQRFDVYSVSIDGESERQQWRSEKDIEQIEMEMLSTDKVRYRLVDLQQGYVNVADQINTELQYDMDMHIDGMALAQLDANAVTEGLRADLNLHPNIKSANVPDKNYLDLSGSDAGVLTVAKLRTIIAHIAQFGSIGGVTEQFSISNIQVSPQNISDPWEFVSLVSGYNSSDANVDNPKNTVPEGVREQIYSSGMFTNAWGHNFSWTPNPTLAKGDMYVFTNRPVGWMFAKPELDSVLTWDERVSPDFAERNYGEMMFRKALKFYVPSLWRQRFLKIKL